MAASAGILVGHGCAVGTLDTGARGAHPYRDREQRGQPATEEQAEDAESSTKPGS